MARLLFLTVLSGCFAAAVSSVAWGQQKFDPPGTKPPPEESIQAIRDKMALLDAEIAKLRKKSVPDTAVAEIEVYHRAAEMILMHGEFYHKDSAAWTLDTLDRGIARARLLAQGDAPWAKASGANVLRAYRSRVDGSVQPYAVTYPHGFGKDPKRKWRIDVVLHGRDASLTEVKFLNAHSGSRKVPEKQDYVQIDIFGRGNNAYRWAGETDVFEAIDHLLASEKTAGRGQCIDPMRVVLRGFSMGGAGTWHLGLHHPGRWCVIGPGAGFTTTHGYVKFAKPLPAYQEACLKIYDAVDYAENAANVPIVAYSGEKDAQKAAADNIEAALKPFRIPMEHLIAPGLAHSFPPAWFEKANRLYSKHVASGRPEYPEKVSFVTYTTKYPGSAWVEIVGLVRHYDKASVQASRSKTGFLVATKNVSALRLTLPQGTVGTQEVRIDGQQLQVKPDLSVGGPGHLDLLRSKGEWRGMPPQLPGTQSNPKPQKVHGLQGPIDDAFSGPFLCVRGTGKPWHASTGQFTEARLAQFQADWSKYFRGTLAIKNDQDVTQEDIAGKHLVLFGDPSSNTLIAKVIGDLPLSWTRDSISCAGTKVSSNDFVPVMIQPNPLNRSHYIVLNSGHTIPSADYSRTNALLFPRLGDYAILPVAGNGGEPVVAGLFNEQWQIEK